MRLTGKTVLITAAAQGIGRASAIACAREGAQVIATDLDLELLEHLQLEYPSIRIERLDVRDSAAVHSLAAKLPSLDGLFNCAGFVHDGLKYARGHKNWNAPCVSWA